MRTNHFFFLFVIVVMAYACSNASNSQTGSVDTAANDVSLQQKTGKEVESKLWEADSLQILYYDNPDGDSLRYTRFFTYTTTTDTANIKQLLKEMEQPFEYRHDVRKCRSEGKIYFFNGENPLKTLYFSTRGDSCSYLYYISDGMFHYFPLSNETVSFLKQNKKAAIKP